MASEVEVIALHHQRKAQAANSRPTQLADVYGSVWLTAGDGSVILLWGKPGAPVVELHHLKQPAEDIGPLRVVHDHSRGQSTLHEPVDLRALVRQAGRDGLTAPEAARELFGVGSPSANDREKARRKLDALAREGRVEKAPGSRNDPARYVAAERRKRGPQ